MATMTIEYDNRNKTGTRLLSGLIYTGIIHQADAKAKHIEDFKAALTETEAMAKDIAINGTKGYKTLDDLLNED